ncbi:isatin hydrolase-like [Babylonia areolata]|uniref:isatin hydrolase-like n=1 Tax=Babylonia areolata TaxID=304850 RepID=UPI003FD52B2C
MMEAATSPAFLRVPMTTALMLVVVLVVVTSRCDGVTVVDLTHQLKEGESISWPVNPPFNFTIMHRGPLPLLNNLWLENNKFQMPEHMGTHMDAPAHTAKGKLRMHEIPVDRLVGQGVVIDVREKVKANPVYMVTVEDLKEWEERHGRMEEKAIVLVNAGWASRYPDWKRVFGTQDLKNYTSYRHPSVTAEAARWLAEERKILALGMDTPSPDTGSNSRLPVHEVLLGRNILILENVANLNSLPPKGTTIIMGALNIHDGSGAPMRMLALIGSGSCKLQFMPVSSLIVLSLGLGFVRWLVQ